MISPPTKEHQMNIKEELEFQRDQAVAMFDGAGKFASEILILGAVGAAMLVCIFGIPGVIAEVIEILG
jgi:hypothetical protein